LPASFDRLFQKCSETLQATTDLVFPPCCALCHARLFSSDPIVCDDCERQLVLLSAPSCDQCGMPLDMPDEDCTFCVGRTLHFVRAQAVLEFNQPVQTLIHLLKYRDRRSVGRFLGHRIGKIVVHESWFSHIDRIVPVPLHAVRRRERGYNQAEEIARGLAFCTHIPVDAGALLRRHSTRSQTRLSVDERRTNVRNVFGVSTGRHFKNARIALVDDVYTTGATLDECAAGTGGRRRRC